MTSELMESVLITTVLLGEKSQRINRERYYNSSELALVPLARTLPASSLSVGHTVSSQEILADYLTGHP